jgi:hypothetical protein
VRWRSTTPDPVRGRAAVRLRACSARLLALMCDGFITGALVPVDGGARLV